MRGGIWLIGLVDLVLRIKFNAYKHKLLLNNLYIKRITVPDYIFSKTNNL